MLLGMLALGNAAGNSRHPSGSLLELIAPPRLHVIACRCNLLRASFQDYSDKRHAVCSKLCNVWHLLEQPPIITVVAHLEKVQLLNLSAQLISVERPAICQNRSQTDT